MRSRLPMNALRFLLLGSVLVGPAALVYAEFEPESGWNGHLFPSYIVATATMSARSRRRRDGRRRKCDRRPARAAGSLDRGGEDTGSHRHDHVRRHHGTEYHYLYVARGRGNVHRPPEIRYRYDQLAGRTQTGPVTVSYEVEVDDDVEEESQTLTLRSINDCPLPGQGWNLDESSVHVCCVCE